MKAITQVVGLVNQVRQYLGFAPIKRLPKGIRHDDKGCPLARCIPSVRSVKQFYAFFDTEFDARNVAKAWGTDWWYVSDYGVEKPAVILPQPLREFVRDFDQGKYPQYVLPLVNKLGVR